jgi:N-acetylneuraminic acid mutarotase
MKSLNVTKISYSIWVLSGLGLSVLVSISRTSMATEGTWTRKADMPTTRTFVSGCILDGKIYIIGGAPSLYSITSAVEMYDPTANTWTKIANMPSARCAHATCTFDGKIYVFGGCSPDMWSTAKKNVYVYDPKVDTWTEKANMPYTNSACGIAVVDGKIYLIGGSPGEPNPPFPTVMAYDPITESWTQKADMPTARYALAACVLDGKIYAIGGCTEDWRQFSYKKMEVYDPSTDTWTPRSDMPTERWGFGTCVVDRKIFVIGGNSALYAATTANEVYDPITDIWTTESPMQQKRQGLFIGCIGNKIYAIGGSYPDPQPTFLSTVEEYDTGLAVSSPDFNGDGLVDIKDLLRLIESWDQDDPQVDIAPPPFGNGIVDALDLELLMNSWEQPVDDPTLLAHWALDEVEGDIAYDSAGVNDAFVVGGAAWQPSGGPVDGALQLDGIDGCAITGPVLDPADGPFSVLAWIQGGAPGQVALSQLDGVDWLGVDSPWGYLMTDLRESGRNGDPLKSEIVITDGQWHRIGFVWDGFYRSLYVDDILAAADTQKGLGRSDGGLNIGCGTSSGTGTFWSGLVDEVRIYNRAIHP